MVGVEFGGLDFVHAGGAFGLFVCFDKRLYGLISVNVGLFGFEVINVVLDPSNMVFVDEISEIIEGGWGLY